MSDQDLADFRAWAESHHAVGYRPAKLALAALELLDAERARAERADAAADELARYAGRLAGRVVRLTGVLGLVHQDGAAPGACTLRLVREALDGGAR